MEDVQVNKITTQETSQESLKAKKNKKRRALESEDEDSSMNVS